MPPPMDRHISRLALPAAALAMAGIGAFLHAHPEIDRDTAMTTICLTGAGVCAGMETKAAVYVGRLLWLLRAPLMGFAGVNVYAWLFT
jgi:hypothetical protein